MAFYRDKRRYGYSRCDSLGEVREGFKGCRVEQYFILSDKGADRERPTCAACGKPITAEGGNRGHYYPKSGRIVMYHYPCAWGVTLAQVAELGERLGY